MQQNSNHDDIALFSQIADGDQQAFAAFYNKYVDRLFSNACKLLHSEFWAEEVVQLVFTQLWNNRSSLKSVELPVAYLFRMVTNKARDRMRREAREIKMQYWLENQEANKNYDPQQSAALDELHELLAKAVEALPPRRKQVYQMKYQERLSYEEIAVMLNISRLSVRTHMSRALEDIRFYLLKHASLMALCLLLKFF